MKTVLAIFFGLCIGIASALLGSAVSAALLWLCVPHFLRIINIPVLTDRFCTLGYGGYFIFAFTVRLLVGLLFPVNTKPEQK